MVNDSDMIVSYVDTASMAKFASLLKSSNCGCNCLQNFKLYKISDEMPFCIAMDLSQVFRFPTEMD